MDWRDVLLLHKDGSSVKKINKIKFKKIDQIDIYLSIEAQKFRILYKKYCEFQDGAYLVEFKGIPQNLMPIPPEAEKYGI